MVGLVGFGFGYVPLFYCFLVYCGGLWWLTSKIADNYCYCLCKSNVIALFLLHLFLSLLQISSLAFELDGMNVDGMEAQSDIFRKEKLDIGQCGTWNVYYV